MPTVLHSFRNGIGWDHLFGHIAHPVCFPYYDTKRLAHIDVFPLFVFGRNVPFTFAVTENDHLA